MTTGAKIQEVQYFGALALQVIIVAAMIWRRLFPHARYFFAYIVWQTFSVACLYVIMHRFPPPSKCLFYASWINNAIDIVLAIAILVEIFNRVFAPYEGIRGMARILFLAAAGVLIVTSAI